MQVPTSGSTILGDDSVVALSNVYGLGLCVEASSGLRSGPPRRAFLSLPPRSNLNPLSRPAADAGGMASAFSRNQTSEQTARDAIDSHLRRTGWTVQPEDGINLQAGEGQAAREKQSGRPCLVRPMASRLAPSRPGRRRSDTTSPRSRTKPPTNPPPGGRGRAGEGRA